SHTLYSLNTEEASVLQFAICNELAEGRVSNDIDPVRTFKPDLVYSRQRWTLKVNGRTRVTPVYLNIYSKFDEKLASPLFDQDILIFANADNHSRNVQYHEATDFSISLQLPLLFTLSEGKDAEHGLRRLLVFVQDCFHVHKLQLLMFADEISPDRMMWDATSQDIFGGKINSFKNSTSQKTMRSLIARIFSTGDVDFIHYLVLLCFVATAVIVILVLNILICLIERRRRYRLRGVSFKHLHLKDANDEEFIVISGGKSSRSESGYMPLGFKSSLFHLRQSTSPVQGFTFAKKAILVTYICFRVFYTFIFTFSVALSILFSFWPPVGVDKPRFHSSWDDDVLPPGSKLETFRLEAEAAKILKRQSTKATQLVHVCQDQMIRQVIDVTREVDRTVQEILETELNPQKPRDNVFRLLETFVFLEMKDLNPAVQDYVGQLRTDLDNSVMPEVVRFSELLSSVYASQWLLFAKRMIKNTSVPQIVSSPGAHLAPTPEHLSALRLTKSVIDFARQFGFAEAESFLFVPTLITTQLEDTVLNKIPSKNFQPNFLASVYMQPELAAHGKFKKPQTLYRDTFKPLESRSFATIDDHDAIVQPNEGQTPKDSPNIFSRFAVKQPHKDKVAGGSFMSHLLPMSLGQLRLTFFFIDCYLIVTRFYNTYPILREILAGRTLVVDAATYFGTQSGLPPQHNRANGKVKQDDSKPVECSVFHQETYFHCAHSSKPMIRRKDPSWKCQQNHLNLPKSFFRPIQSVHEVTGATVSPLQMTFARTNQIIFIFFGCSSILLLAIFAISTDYQLLRVPNRIFCPSNKDENRRAILGDDFYKQSERLIYEHVQSLNEAILAKTLLNEQRLRRRMLRFTAQFNHDLKHFELQLRTETCQISSLFAQAKWPPDPKSVKTTSSLATGCLTPTWKQLNVENLLRQKLCQFLPLRPSRLPRFSDNHSQGSQRRILISKPFTYLWRALANWVSGSVCDTQDPYVVSQFLAIVLFIAVVMLGLVGIFHSAGVMCHILHRGNPTLGQRGLHLLSSVPPPLKHKFGPPRVYSAIDIEALHASPASSQSMVLSGAKREDTACFGVAATLNDVHQIVLFSNSPQRQPTLVISSEYSPQVCRSNSQQTES
uniref:Transmembrane protein 231 n=1 Tax=Mesocestoides corti TaxID=53468 RepID=A0A5K3EGS8_MESCO